MPRTDVMISITDGFDDRKDEAFGLVSCGIGNPPHYRHRRAFIRLCESRPRLDGAGLAAALVAQATRNWIAGRERYGAAPSRQNWRFNRAGNMAAHNRSPEVTFERALVEAGGDRWANQVPTCSGLIGYRADTRRSIDLVERVGDQSFDLIELKIASNTPLFAALEVLDYGALYAFTRINRDELGYPSGFSEILDAHEIGLRVLAPQSFYQGKSGELALSWLEDMMRHAAAHLASLIGDGTTMDFRFDVFADRFSWGPEDNARADHARAMMEGRRPLHP